jgi:hypothetical protein
MSLIMYNDGQQAAFLRFKLAEEDSKSSWRNWRLPALGAGLAGRAGYKYFRTAKGMPKSLYAQKLRDASQQGFHRVVDVTQQPKPAANRAWNQKLRHAIRPQLNNAGQLDTLNKFKLRALEGSDAIPVGYHQGKTVMPLHPEGADVKGVVYNRNAGAMSNYKKDPKHEVRGGIDWEGNDRTQNMVTDLSNQGKSFERNFLGQHAPNSIPKTITGLHDFVPRYNDTLEGRIEAAKQFQNRLTEHMRKNGVKGDFMLKYDHGLDSKGQFPRSGMDWGEKLKIYENVMANPTLKDALTNARKGGDNGYADFLRNNNAYEGYTLHKAINSPGRVFAQERIQNPLGEYRVHAVGGQAPKDLVYPRHSENIAESMSGRKADISKFVENEVLGRMPEDVRNGAFGIDVMPHKNPDGSVGYKVLELNPHQKGYKGTSEMPGGPGFSSGLLNSDRVPLTAHKQYKAVTGKDTKSMALLKALGLGGAGRLTGNTARNALQSEDDEGKKKQLHE